MIGDILVKVMVLRLTTAASLASLLSHIPAADGLFPPEKPKNLAPWLTFLPFSILGMVLLQPFTHHDHTVSPITKEANEKKMLRVNFKWETLSFWNSHAIFTIEFLQQH